LTGPGVSAINAPAFFVGEGVMALQVTGKNLTIDQLVAVARQGLKVEVAPEALERIKASRAFIEQRIAAKEIMYGTNTGIGEFSEVVLNDDQLKDFQRFLIYNHAAGIGKPLPLEVVRGAMLGRINCHAAGYSGCRPVITLTLSEMLNRGVTPVVCEKGSVGACGDLAPMSQIALAMIGQWEAFYEGQRMPAAKALEKAGIKPVVLEARDGLSTINGSNVLTALGALCIHDMERWLLQSEVAAAMTLDALIANMKPYDVRLHQIRGFPGAVTSARNLRRILDDSDVMKGKVKTKVQDAYSMRSTPQVVGAARDQMRWTRQQIEIELNGAADNPLFLADQKVVLTGANFQGSPVSISVDASGASVCMVCVLSERRLNRLLNPALSVGLPDFLTKGAGMFSGLMLSQYTAGMMIAEQRILSHPAYTQSIPAAADQEDFVSMGMNSSLKTRQILDNAHGILGIELIAAAQALDFRAHTPGKGVRAAHAAIRKIVAHLDEDRPLFDDHNAMAAAVERLDILKAVEAEIGPLDIY
jgi:histidine ammonia-lyase